jgi:hypothetical protein
MLIHNTLAILFSIISPFILIINQKHPLMFLRSLTTEAMRILRFAGAFAVVKRQSECGRNTC